MSPTDSPATVVVMAKEPRPGRVKTRLSPPCSIEQAARLAETALADTLETVTSAAPERRVLALDGEPGSWLPEGFEIETQRGDGLDERLAAAIAGLSSPVVVIGMDTPQITAADIRAAIAGLDTADAVLGFASDGGWWVGGLRQPDPEAFVGVPMSRPDTGRLQHQRFEDLGLSVYIARELRDVDTFDDALAVAALAPNGRFAAEVERVRAELETRTPS